MIIKSHVRGGYRAAADYLKEQGKNEKIRLVEISDPDAKNLDEAFRNMWTVANSTKATKPLHHVSINPMKDERLTDKQVSKIVERLEEKYRYKHDDHQRVIVEHVKDGRQHFHVMWNRVSLKTGRPVWPGHHWLKSKQAAREMEQELGLKRPMSRRAHSASIAKISGSSSVKYTSMPHIIGSIRPVMGYRPFALKQEPSTTHHPPAIWLKRRTNSYNMPEEQRLDYIAACDGKITWRQYFRKWGGLSL